MDNFKEALARTLQFEGGYVNHPADKGGPTNRGVTQATAKAAGYEGDMQTLPDAIVDKVYRQIWDKVRAQDLCTLNRPKTAAALFDAAVHSGPKQAGRFLQNAINLCGGSTLVVDGVIGTSTLGAVTGLRDRVLAQALLIERGTFLTTLVKKNSTQRAFLAGWLDRVAKQLAALQ